ncbi:uncharacterized protein BXZ73DRAFT_60252 [Epithele typhae]|uniref:uncharacterized protein n=1 Tax=Epithele typhae TaxID=378194 RepID=UPI002008C8CA|nr:uncharacterized protein BXZ73DRAFT_60252 [Epithele typhae]KAH9907683.1 hypothetical protein BXZ73DRAFT_60252 [Epithele typhae]
MATIVNSIATAAKSLPSSVPIGNENDKIYIIMTKTHGDTAWETFNRRFDILFGEDCRDPVTGRLHHLRRGACGLDMVIKDIRVLLARYEAELQYNVMRIKLKRLLTEVAHLRYVVLHIRIPIVLPIETLRSGVPVESLAGTTIPGSLGERTLGHEAGAGSSTATTENALAALAEKILDPNYKKPGTKKKKRARTGAATKAGPVPKGAHKNVKGEQ